VTVHRYPFLIGSVWNAQRGPLDLFQIITKSVFTINWATLGVSGRMTQKRALTPPTSPSPQRMRLLSPALPEMPSSPLPPSSLPAISSPPQSSSNRVFIKERPSSPDLFEPFVYNTGMDVDLRRIDIQASQELAEDNDIPSSPPAPPVTVSVPLPTTTAQDKKAWVVFVGKVPGLYTNP
jgi:hypothetical protein